MHLDVRAVESPEAVELYLTATPTPRIATAEQAREMFAAIAELLRERGAWICQERVFAPANLTGELGAIRAQAYGSLDDGVEPTWLSGASAAGQMAGVQVHVVCGMARPRRLEVDGVALGRTFERNGLKWVVASAISSAEAGDPFSQARRNYEKAEVLLKQVGGDMKSVARTWIFMDDILSWYGDFNKARSGFFVERELLGPKADGRMPASTGIGVSPSNRAKCAMDLYAVVGPDDAVKRFHAAGKQRSAYEYGSAFARGATAKTPAGKTVYVSGTASIDTTGATIYVGDVTRQIQVTLENVVAVLRELGCGPRDVVQAMAYCATPAVEQEFETCWKATLPWPWVTMIGDVCRGDLLFEVEATAGISG